MPGIVGFVPSTDRPLSKGKIVEQMVAPMLHESSYVSGTLVEETSGLAVGWVCHRGSFSDCLPIWNETRDVCLVFVGEDFRDEADLRQLREDGHSFEGDKAGYIVHLYEAFGSSAFERLNGIFSGLLIDLRKREAVLFNDRYGLGRVYCYQSDDGFYFASEAKALLRLFPQARSLDMRSFAEVFSCGCVLQNRTLFSGISLLPAASAWVLRAQAPVQRKTYFSATAWEKQPQLPEQDYFEQLKTTFSGVLPNYFRGASSMSMSLTGGLDSRMVMAWAGAAPSRLPCYSHRGMFRECIDSKVARRVATVCQQPHQVLCVDGPFFSEFPALARRTVYITDGCMDVSGAAGLYVNRISARQIAPVRMTGNYGGEVLRRLVALNPAKLRNRYFDPEFDALVNEGKQTLEAEGRVNRNSFIAFKQVPWHHYSRFAMESSQLTIRSPFLDNRLVALAYQAPLDSSVNLHQASRLIGEGNPKLAAFPTDRGPLGRGGIFGKAAEVWQELTFRADYAYDYGMPHWLANLDRVFAPLHLERLFLGRHKYYHFRYWYRHQLAGYVKEMLLDPRTLARPHLDRRAVENMVNAHVKGTGNFTSEIHALLTTELMFRELLER